MKCRSIEFEAVGCQVAAGNSSMAYRNLKYPVTENIQIKAVLFDFDGTLTKPGSIEFEKIKSAIGCPSSTPILEYIEGIPHYGEKKKAVRILEEMEMAAAKKSEPNIGAEALVSRLCSKMVPIGIISRNSVNAIKAGLKNFKRITAADFNVIISRDDPIKPKPSGEGILKAAHDLNVNVNQVAMVGDFVFDIQAGREAGAITVFIHNGRADKFPDTGSDIKISRLTELMQVLKIG